jgi:hypothetical protein
VCAAATEVARDAAIETAGEVVGEHLGAEVEGDRVVTHYFASTQPGYVGWRWAVTVARAPRAKNVTVSEISLLPGTGALIAPEWLPWSERLRPGDLGVGDMLPTAPDDDRLVPGYEITGDLSAPGSTDEITDPAIETVAFELGLGRPRVMSRLGRLEAAERWYDADRGPQAPIALAAPARCGTCGFYLQLAGSLRAMFGVCGNEFAPDDARVVSADHGCGAHSEALVEAPVAAGPPAVDDAEVELLALGPLDDADTESLGHS